VATVTACAVEFWHSVNGFVAEPLITGPLGVGRIVTVTVNTFPAERFLQPPTVAESTIV
jgi:hypothetical protein